MLPSPVPAAPGWDEDLAWLDRDPEREVWLARAREHDEAPAPGEEEYEDYAPFTPDELAGIDEAAAAARDDGFDGISEAELVGVMCWWDRVEAHAHARKLAAIAELARRNPGELDQEFTRDQVAYALGESRARADSLIGMAQTLPRCL